MANVSNDSPLDCLIVGAGPAGLLAATYLARFRRSLRVAHDNASRASLIPRSHNYPGYAQGIAGEEILARLRAQAERYRVPIVNAHVANLRREGALFVTEMAGDVVRARNIILATGVVDIEPALPDVADAVRRGYVRHCPICDAYEVQGQKVAVIGRGEHALKEALFIRHYTDDLTLLAADEHAFDDAQRARAGAAGIAIIEDPVSQVHIDGARIRALRMHSGREHAFDTIYSALGAKVRSQLAVGLNARHNKEGSLEVDAHQQTSVDGLYAAGDVVSTLNQIAVAFAHAALAATAIHNRLRE